MSNEMNARDIIDEVIVFARAAKQMATNRMSIIGTQTAESEILNQIINDMNRIVAEQNHTIGLMDNGTI